MRKILVASILGFALILSSCRSAPADVQTTPAISVKVTPLLEGEVIEGFTTIGAVKPASIVEVTPLSSGRVAAVFVQVGDRVAAGDILYSLESDNQQNTLNQTASALRATRNTLAVQLNDAEQNYQTVKALFEQGAASQVELANARSQLDSLKIRYQDAVTAYANQTSSLKSALAERDITAPISGLVVDVPIAVGEIATAQTVVPLIDDSQFIATSQLTPEQLRQLDQVEKITAYLAGDSTQPLTAQLQRIDYTQSTSTGTYPVRVTLDSGRQTLFDGEYLELFFQTASRPVLQLPITAIKTLGQDVYAYYVKDGRAVRQTIAIGRYNGDLVEVIDVESRDWIVSNVDQLQSGVAVSVVNQSNPE